MYSYIPESETKKDRFDVLSFSLLAITVASLQMILDRGEQVDWLESLEIQTYVIIVGLMFYLYWVRTWITKQAFFSPKLFTDTNFVSSLISIFIIGSVQMSSMAILPPFLQQWQGYSVYDAGMLIMPRGIGMMISMMSVHQLMKRFDARAIIFAGFVMVIFASWRFSCITLDVSAFEITYLGIIHGIGIGLTFVPVTALAYATLEPQLRAEAAALFSLARNIGGSIGVSFMMTQLSRNMWVNQQELSARLQLEPNMIPQMMANGNPTSLMGMVTQTIARQSAEISHVNIFYMLMITVIISMPVIALVKAPKN
jgi:DHA2 family multidrug resistance protein